MPTKLPDFDRSKMGNNPFLNDFFIPVSVLTSDTTFKVVPSNEHGENPILVKSEYVAERQQYTRLYYATGAKLLVFGLSDRAQRLYLYILMNLERKQDYIQINKDDYMRKNNIKSRTTYTEAINELSRYCIIYQSVQYKSVYWTNPKYFASSDRVAMYPKNLKTVTDGRND